MTPRITNLERVFDPWAATQDDRERVAAVLMCIAWIADNYDEVLRTPALPGGHPLRRDTTVPDHDDIIVSVILTHPNRGVHLRAIIDLGELLL